jgi:hypothetical protein
MAYAIITGAHLNPYSWFYDEIGYAVAAIMISFGSLLIALIFKPVDIFCVPVFTASILLILGIWIFFRNQRLQKTLHNRKNYNYTTCIWINYQYTC